MKTVSALSLVLGSLVLGGCSSSGEVQDPQSTDEAVTGSKIENIIVPLSDLETSRTHSAKKATIKLTSVAGAQTVSRCHQYLVTSPREQAITVCSDDKVEIVMDGKYGTYFTRWARVRFANGSPEALLNCVQTDAHEFSTEAYGGITVQKCTPAARATQAARDLFAVVDADPTITEYPTRSVYLRTLWTKTPAETFAGNWDAKLAKAIPDGEYKGYGSSSSHPCKIKVKTTDGITNVQVVSLAADGAERVNAKVDVSPKSVTGAFSKSGVPQQVSSASREASVLIVNTATDTATTDYYSRNVRVVRFPDVADGARANPDSGQSAVYIDDNYCQRLDPAIPAW